MAKIYLLGIFLVALLVGTIVYLDSDGQLTTQYVEQTFKGFIQDKTIFPDGSSVNVLSPDQPESEKKTPSKEARDKALSKDATMVDKAVEKIATPDPNINQYSKADSRGVVVAGYILLKDDYTGENIKPYNYKVYISIQCDEDKNMVDGFNFCSTDSIFGRVTTEHGGKDEDGNELGGWFDYAWHPKNSDSSAFYDVDILVTKDQVGLDGKYQDYHVNYKVQVL